MMDKKDKNWFELRNVSNQKKIGAEESKKRLSLLRLKEIIEKTCRTIFIGNISKFEAFFGNEWGHGLTNEQCTKKQEEVYDIWQQCRDEILNFSNKHLRDLVKKLEYFDVFYKGNVVEFRSEK